MPTCPAGHSSTGADPYCEVCGLRMTDDGSAASSGSSGAAASPPSGSSGSVPSTSSSASSSAPGMTCPDCGETITGRFCEGCGYDRENPTPVSTPVTAGESAGGAAEPGWQVVVGADYSYYERVMAEVGADPAELPFPAYAPDRSFPLQGEHVRIGRRSASGGFVPEIDLSRPPEDPAVSHEHAVLLPKPDASWVLVDLDSTNGTTVNDEVEPVRANVEVPLKEGDRVYVGAWTVITVRRA